MLADGERGREMREGGVHGEREREVGEIGRKWREGGR